MNKADSYQWVPVRQRLPGLSLVSCADLGQHGQMFPFYVVDRCKSSKHPGTVSKFFK